MLPLYKQFPQSSLEKNSVLIFIQIREWEDSFLHFFWSSEKSEFFWSLWLIRIATSIQTVLTVIIGKIFNAVFHFKTGVRGLFVTLFNLSSEESEFFSSLWLIRSATSIQTVFTVIIAKKNMCWFSFKNGCERTFSNTF